MAQGADGARNWLVAALQALVLLGLTVTISEIRDLRREVVENTRDIAQLRAQQSIVLQKLDLGR